MSVNDEPQSTSLQVNCGPHCGTKDGVTGHCQMCHALNDVAAQRMAEHLGTE